MYANGEIVHYNIGKHQSEETRSKISRTKMFSGKPGGRLGKKNSEEHRLRSSLARKGKPTSLRGQKRMYDIITNKIFYYKPINISFSLSGELV